MARYKPDHRGVAEWAKSQEMLDMLTERAEDGKLAAESGAIVLASLSSDLLDYANSFHVGSGAAVVGRKNELRIAATLYNTDPAAGRIEWHDRIMNNAIGNIQAGSGRTRKKKKTSRPAPMNFIGFGDT